jgi:hypothetical protein
VSVPAKEGDVLKATWGKEKTTARVRKFKPVDLRIRFPIPSGEEDLEVLRGEWHYETIHPGRIGENRAGEIDVKSTHVVVRGREVWRRPQMQLNAVYTEDLEPIHELPLTPDRYAPPVWMNVTGFSLPVETMRRAIVTTRSPYVRVLPNTRRHPEHRRVMQFLAQIRADVTPAPVVFEINGQKVSWLPEMQGQEPIALRLTRKRSDVEFDAIREAGIGDVLYLEAEYNTVPFCNTQTFGLIATDLYGYEASDDERSRALKGAAADPEITEGKTASEEGAQSSYWNINWFELALRGSPGAEAAKVLDRAQSAITGRRVIEDRDLLRTEPISEEDHAAAIVLRDQLVANLQDYQDLLGRMENLTPEGTAAIVQAAINGDFHPLLPVVIKIPSHRLFTDEDLENWKWPLGWIIDREVFENWFSDDREEFMKFARKAIVSANSKASIDTSIALQKNKKP